MQRRIHFSTLPRPEANSRYHVWTKAPTGMVVTPKAIRFSVNMALMGVFTYNRNEWQTQGKSYAHAIFHWSEMKTYQTALSGKWSFSEFSSTPWEKKKRLPTTKWGLPEQFSHKSYYFSYFVATCATSFRIMTPCFTMWVNKYSAMDSVYLLIARP